MAHVGEKEILPLDGVLSLSQGIAQFLFRLSQVAVLLKETHQTVDGGGEEEKHCSYVDEQHDDLPTFVVNLQLIDLMQSLLQIDLCDVAPRTGDALLLHLLPIEVAGYANSVRTAHSPRRKGEAEQQPQ